MSGLRRTPAMVRSPSLSLELLSDHFPQFVYSSPCGPTTRLKVRTMTDDTPVAKNLAKTVEKVDKVDRERAERVEKTARLRAEHSKREKRMKAKIIDMNRALREIYEISISRHGTDEDRLNTISLIAQASHDEQEGLERWLV